jgi:hypothetical protein
VDIRYWDYYCLLCATEIINLTKKLNDEKTDVIHSDRRFKMEIDAIQFLAKNLLKQNVNYVVEK